MAETVKLAALLGGLLGGGLLLGGPLALRAFTSDPAAIAAAAPLLPLVAASQPINALAFVWDGAWPLRCTSMLISFELHQSADCEGSGSVCDVRFGCGLVNGDGGWRLFVHLAVCTTTVTLPD